MPWGLRGLRGLAQAAACGPGGRARAVALGLGGVAVAAGLFGWRRWRRGVLVLAAAAVWRGQRADGIGAGGGVGTCAAAWAFQGWCRMRSWFGRGWIGMSAQPGCIAGVALAQMQWVPVSPALRGTGWWQGRLGW